MVIFSEFFFKKFVRRHLNFIFFCFFGMIAFFIDGLVCQAFYFKLSFPLSISRIMSMFIAINFTWFMNRTFTFRSIKRISFLEWLFFVCSALFGASINYFVFMLTVSIYSGGILGLWIGVSFGSISGLLFNYNSAKYIFRRYI